MNRLRIYVRCGWQCDLVNMHLCKMLVSHSQGLWRNDYDDDDEEEEDKEEDIEDDKEDDKEEDIEEDDEDDKEEDKDGTWKHPELGSRRWSQWQCRSTAEHDCLFAFVFARLKNTNWTLWSWSPCRQDPPSTSFCSEYRASASSEFHRHTGKRMKVNLYSKMFYSYYI